MTDESSKSVKRLLRYSNFHFFFKMVAGSHLGSAGHIYR